MRSSADRGYPGEGYSHGKPAQVSCLRQSENNPFLVHKNADWFLREPVDFGHSGVFIFRISR